MTERIGLNLLWMVPGVVGGSEEYTTRLLTAVSERPDRPVEPTLFVNSLFPRVYPALVDAFETVVAPVSGTYKSARVVAESSWLVGATARRSLGVMHHLGGILPFYSRTRDIVTIHDLQPLTMPGHFSPVKRTFSRLTIPRSARRAELVVTLSAFTRDDLQRKLGVAPERVRLVPPGVRFPEEEQPASPADIRRRYGLGAGPFFLLPAITYPHKNHLMLLEALSLLRRRHPEASLVLTSGAAQMEEAIRDRSHEPDLRGSVFRLGRIPQEDLDVLYRTAVALAFPSRFEGFGLPILEAMSRRCPVIAADVTALPEAVGDAGLLVSPDRPEAWADAMESLLTDESRRAQLVEAGLAHARRYDWPSAADKLLAVWSEVTGG